MLHRSCLVFSSYPQPESVPSRTTILQGQSAQPHPISIHDRGLLRVRFATPKPTGLVTHGGLLNKESESFGPRFRGPNPISIVRFGPRCESLGNGHRAAGDVFRASPRSDDGLAGDFAVLVSFGCLRCGVHATSQRGFEVHAARGMIQIADLAA